MTPLAKLYSSPPYFPGGWVRYRVDIGPSAPWPPEIPVFAQVKAYDALHRPHVTLYVLPVYRALNRALCAAFPGRSWATLVRLLNHGWTPSRLLVLHGLGVLGETVRALPARPGGPDER